jgi:hypothetical protein
VQTTAAIYGTFTKVPEGENSKFATIPKPSKVASPKRDVIPG